MAEFTWNENVKKKFLQKVSDKLDIVAIKVVETASDLAPHDTGLLKSSIDILEKTRFSRKVGTAVEYAVYQEFGTYKMSPQPFLIPAFLMVKKAIKQIFKGV